MVIGILAALCAGIAICHSHHKKQQQRFNAYQQEYAAQHGRPMTKQEWKQLRREHRQARKAEKHLRRADRRRGCCSWRRTQALPPPPSASVAQDPPSAGVDVKYPNGEYHHPVESQREVRIPVQGPDDEPPAYAPGPMAAPTEKM